MVLLGCMILFVTFMLLCCSLGLWFAGLYCGDLVKLLRA